MKNFVKLIQQVHAERFSVVMNNIIAKRIPVAFLSISPTDQAVETVKNFRAQGLNVTNLIVIDNSPPVNLNFNVIHVRYAAQIYPQPEYVFTFNSLESNIARKFFGDSKVIWQYPIRGLSTDVVFEIFMAHLSELQEVYESLIDEESKKTFRGYWLGCISNQSNVAVYANTPQYICAGFLPKAGDVVIDCGAYDGGTAARFVNMGCEVYSFEMDSDNYERARKTAEEKNFVVENLGLGAYKHEANYDHSGAATGINSQGTETAQITTVDNYVGEKGLTHVDFIKMDVEGAELDILKGAAMTIARYKPILALSAYHKLDDFWTLTNFIKSLRPDYEFALRQYATTPEDIVDWFPKVKIDLLEKLNMEINEGNYEECVLFAR